MKVAEVGECTFSASLSSSKPSHYSLGCARSAKYVINEIN